MSRTFLFHFRIAAAAALLAASPLAASAQPVVSKAVKPIANHQLSVVRVNVTSQGYNFIRPWTKQEPYSQRGLGVVLAGGKVLVTGELVANANDVELEKPGSEAKSAARVLAVDYEANLALLEPDDAGFLKGVPPLAISEANVGDKLSILQLERNSSQLSTSVLVTSVDVSGYPTHTLALLTYHGTAALQYRDNSYTLPVVKNGKLVGMLMRYEAQTQNVDLIAAPVIEHFLKDVDQVANGQPDRGFPQLGGSFASLRDPQLRHYVGLKNPDTGGIYVTGVQKGGSADAAGLREGDVLLAVDGHDVDDDGNYNDPFYGKISINHIITTRHFVGDKIPLKIFRDGKTKTLTAILTHRAASDFVVDPFIIDKAPRFYVLGGLVFQELSRPYLESWGSDWVKKAPEEFVYDDVYQDELFKNEKRKLVILSMVLPAPCNLGYEDLKSLTVTRVNGVEIKNLDDLAKAVEHPQNGFQIIDVVQSPKRIVLDAAEVEKLRPAIMQNYGLHSYRRL